MTPINRQDEVGLESHDDHYQSLQALLHRLRDISESIPFLHSQGYKPPIIDRDEPAPNADSISGLRIFKDAVNREIEVLEQFLSRTNHEADLSTNSYYFISVWNELLSATPPIVAIGKVFDPPRDKKKNAANLGAKMGGIKVDVVADEGRQWIRVNTMKNSRIMAEFREFDSYLTGSEDEGSISGEAFNPPTDQDNSLLRMGRALKAASTIPMAGTNERPSVTLRLTRLNPESSDGDTDPRIGQTIDALNSMGIIVELGERSFRSLHDDPVALRSCSELSAQFHPTSRINLDLSMLIALVSDLSHAHLPQNEDEAWSRFRMPLNARSWKLGKGKTGESLPGDSGHFHESGDLSKHSRALSLQCIQEMMHGLVEEVAGRLKALSLPDEACVPEFWTTEEARDRCLQIVHKIGGPGEKRRVSALFPRSSEAAADTFRCQTEFWHGSRYPASYIPSFLPIRIHPSSLSPTAAYPTSPFWSHLIHTCRHIISHDAKPHPKLYRKDGEMERAKVTKVNTKLTVHTVESMLVGAYAGMTTLTANKASVKAILREMKAVKPTSEENSAVESPSRVGTDMHDTGMTAAIWIVEPRSLAEGMRADQLL